MLRYDTSYPPRTSLRTITPDPTAARCETRHVQAQSRVQDIRAQQALSARVAAIAATIGTSEDALLIRVAQCDTPEAVDAMLESIESAAAAGISADQLFGFAP